MRDIFESTIERLFNEIVTTEGVLGCESDGWSAEYWDAVDELGFPPAAAPEELGGAGAGWDDLCGVVRAVGRFAVPTPLPETMFANWLLGAAGIEAVSGALSFAADCALECADGKVSGTLPDVPWGGDVGHVVAVAHAKNARVVVLPTEAAAQCTRKHNIAGEPRDSLTFADIEPLVSAPVPPGLPADVLLLGGAMLRSAQIAGALQSVLDMATSYAGERVQFGRPIGNFQVIQHYVANLAEQTALAVASAEAAFAGSSIVPNTMQIAAAKVCSAEAAGAGAAIGHAVHGAIGFTQEYALQLRTRRLWSWRSEFGSATAWSRHLGEALCSAGATAFWPTITRGTIKAADGGIE